MLLGTCGYSTLKNRLKLLRNENYRSWCAVHLSTLTHSDNYVSGLSDNILAFVLGNKHIFEVDQETKSSRCFKKKNIALFIFTLGETSYRNLNRKICDFRHMEKYYRFFSIKTPQQSALSILVGAATKDITKIETLSIDLCYQQTIWRWRRVLTLSNSIVLYSSSLNHCWHKTLLPSKHMPCILGKRYSKPY